MDSDQHLDDQIPPTLKFERRAVHRHPVNGMATAFCLSGDSFGHMHELVLADYSAGGIGAVAQCPIEPGTTVSLGFEDSSWLARRGVVKRCIPCGDGYRLAIQFQMGLAA